MSELDEIRCLARETPDISGHLMVVKEEHHGCVVQVCVCEDCGFQRIVWWYEANPPKVIPACECPPLPGWFKGENQGEDRT